MKTNFAKRFILGVIIFAFLPTFFLHADGMGVRIAMATEILRNKQGSGNPIPAGLLKRAKGVAIFKLTRAGFGVGGEAGEGIVVANHDGTWTAPSAFDLGGGSFGAQIGYSEARYIVVLNTSAGLSHFITSEKVDWNADATGTAGNENVNEEASTSDLSKRGIVVYKDTEGVFGGATLGGSEVEVRNDINRGYYGKSMNADHIILQGKAKHPKAARELYKLLSGK